MTTRKEDDIKVRVPAAMRSALARIAQARMTTVSEIAREALLDYLAARNVTVEQLHEESKAATTGPEKPVTYRRKAPKEDTRRKILDIVEKRVKQVAKQPPHSK